MLRHSIYYTALLTCEKSADAHTPVNVCCTGCCGSFAHYWQQHTKGLQCSVDVAVLSTAHTIAYALRCD
jgi:hypothetical protein